MNDSSTIQQTVIRVTDNSTIQQFNNSTVQQFNSSTVQQFKNSTYRLKRGRVKGQGLKGKG